MLSNSTVFIQLDNVNAKFQIVTSCFKCGFGLQVTFHNSIQWNYITYYYTPKYPSDPEMKVLCLTLT